MNGFFGQVSQRVNPRLVLQKHFQKDAWDGETWIGVILVVAAMMALVVVLHFLLYYEKRTESGRELNDPQRLFREVIQSLNFSASQHALLVRLARDLRPALPTQMLLSPRLFADAKERWLASGASGTQQKAEDLTAIADILFPSCTFLPD